MHACISHACMHFSYMHAFLRERMRHLLLPGIHSQSACSLSSAHVSLQKHVVLPNFVLHTDSFLYSCISHDVIIPSYHASPNLAQAHNKLLISCTLQYSTATCALFTSASRTLDGICRLHLAVAHKIRATIGLSRYLLHCSRRGACYFECYRYLLF
jgi:hypothetical protein